MVTSTPGLANGSILTLLTPPPIPVVCNYLMLCPIIPCSHRSPAVRAPHPSLTTTLPAPILPLITFGWSIRPNPRLLLLSFLNIGVTSTPLLTMPFSLLPFLSLLLHYLYLSPAQPLPSPSSPPRRLTLSPAAYHTFRKMDWSAAS